MVRSVVSSLLLPTQLGPWLLRDWPGEAQGPVMCAVPQSGHVLAACCQADPVLEQVLTGSSSTEGGREEAGGGGEHEHCHPSLHRLSRPLGAVARLAHGSGGGTLALVTDTACQLHPQSTWQELAVGMGCLFAQGRCQQASHTLRTGGDGYRWTL